MKKLSAIVKKEVLQHLRSFRFAAVACILLALTALAAFVGTDDYRQRLDIYRQQAALSETELDSITVYSYLQPIVARPPQPLSVLGRGFEDHLGNALRINVYTIPAPAIDAGGLLAWPQDVDLVPELDSVLIVRLVLGLLALLLAFDAVIGEKEKGTLKLVLANDLSRPMVILGKYLGAFLASTVPLLAGVALTLWILFERGGVALEVSHWQRLAVLLAAGMAYLSAMSLLGLLLSILARSTSSALMYSLFAWLVVVFLVPQAATHLATAASPVDPQALESQVKRLEAARDREIATLALARDEGRTKLDTSPFWNTGFTGMIGADLIRYGTELRYEAWADYHRQEVAIARHYAEEIFAVRQAHGAEVRKTEKLARMLSMPSPAFLLERLAEALAGTAIDDQERFLQEARDYREALLGYLESKRAFSERRWFTDDLQIRPWFSLTGVTREEAERIDKAVLIERFNTKENQQIRARDAKDPARRLNLDDLRPFEPSGPELLSALRRVSPEIVALVVFNLLLAGAVVRTFRRYDVSAMVSVVRVFPQRLGRRARLAAEAASVVDPLPR